MNIHHKERIFFILIAIKILFLLIYAVRNEKVKTDANSNSQAFHFVLNWIITCFVKIILNRIIV